MLALSGAVASFALAALILLAAGLPTRVRVGLSTAPVKESIAPAFAELDSLAGYTVVLNFWATWCAPCEAEMPDLQALSTKYHERGLRVLGVNVDEPEEVFRSWAEARGVSFDLLPEPAGRLQQSYEIRGVPQTFLIDPEGVIREVYFGPVTLNRIEAAMRGWLR